MVKYAIYKTSYGGLYAWKYADSIEDIKQYPYISEDSLPVKINSNGGYCSFVMEYEIGEGFLEFRKIRKGQNPLKFNEICPKNSEQFYFGWIAPNGDTYSCGFEGHRRAADAICKYVLHNNSVYDAQRELEERGWISVFRQVPYTPDNQTERAIYLAHNMRVTKQQMDKINELGLMNSRGYASIMRMEARANRMDKSAVT